MGRHRYQAIDQTGKVRRGTVVALHQGDLGDRLRERGLTLIKSKAVEENSQVSRLSSGKFKPRMLVEFYRRFAQTQEMGCAGQPTPGGTGGSGLSRASNGPVPGGEL